MLSVSRFFDSFLNLLRGKEEGGPFSRFKSWEYCHERFLHYHNSRRELEESEIDLLALNLSFYLASWGMYRGSSFILQRDYKTHKEIVRRVFKSDYNSLWDYDPINSSDEEMKEIAECAYEAYKDIVDAYGDIPERYFAEGSGADADKPVSITLITKILMGTFAISPAFDRFFIDGIKCHNANHEAEMGCQSHYFDHEEFIDDLVQLFKFANRQRENLVIPAEVTRANYPIMKRVDMYFWEVGYEYGFYCSLRESEEKVDSDSGMIEGTKSKKAFVKILKQIETIFPEFDFSGNTDKDKIISLKEQLNARLDLSESMKTKKKKKKEETE